MNTNPHIKALACVLSLVLTLPAVAELTLYDDFSGLAGTNAPKWDEVTLGAGRVYFTNGQAFLDMSSPVAGMISQLHANQATFRFVQCGDSFRVTWDMQIVSDDFYSFGGGVAVGRQGGSAVTAGQSGRENEEPTFGAHHNFFPYIAPEQDVDRGVAAYHFDLRMTMISTNGEVRGLLRVYARNALLDATPAAYATRGSLIQSTDFPGRIDLPDNLGVYFWVLNSFKNDPDCCNQARGTLAVDNVFTEFRSADSLALTGVAGTGIYTAVEICWPTESSKLYKVQWTLDVEMTNWVDLGCIYGGTGATNCIFDTARDRARKFYRVMELQ